MDKLHYGSFYKFLVSVGIILVMAPLVGLYYLLCNGNQILISQAEYDHLSTNSLIFIQQRDCIVSFAFSVLPWILFLLAMIGLVCMIYGSFKWYGIQKELDEQTKLITQERRLNIEHLNIAEVVEKLANEKTHEDGIRMSNKSNEDLNSSAFIKAIKIEDMCYSYIKQRNSNLYDVHQNIRIGKIELDMIAISKKNNVDILYEIKYWPLSISSKNMDYVANRLNLVGPAYENVTHRNWNLVLFVVTSDDNYEKIRSQCNDYMKAHSLNFSVHVITESRLMLQNKR